MPAAPQSVVRRRKTGKAMIQGDRELIDAYLQGTLPPAERLVFETRLQTDAVLKKETEAVALVLPMIQLAGRMHLKTKLRSIEATLPASLEEYTPSKNNKGKLKAKGKISLKWWWVAVAAGIIAAGVTWYLFFYHAHPEGEGCSNCDMEQTVPVKQDPVVPPVQAAADTISMDSAAGAVPSGKPDVYDPKLNSIEENAGASKSKPPASVKATKNVKHMDSVPLYSSAWQIADNVMLSAADVRSNKPVIVNVDSKSSYTFHYRFESNKLTLFGPFLNSLLFYDNAGSRLVLRYREKYYPLPPVTTITPLTEGRVLGDGRSQASGK